MAEKQVKSRQRVADHGEVFTAEREVRAMCDLVKSETERIESRFLEPACGNGNFLTEVLRRKLAVAKTRRACRNMRLCAVFMTMGNRSRGRLPAVRNSTDSASRQCSPALPWRCLKPP